jgi:hypothetical protein
MKWHIIKSLINYCPRRFPILVPYTVAMKLSKELKSVISKYPRKFCHIHHRRRDNIVLLPQNLIITRDWRPRKGRFNLVSSLGSRAHSYNQVEMSLTEKMLQRLNCLFCVQFLCACHTAWGRSSALEGCLYICCVWVSQIQFDSTGLDSVCVLSASVTLRTKL